MSLQGDQTRTAFSGSSSGALQIKGSNLIIKQNLMKITDLEAQNKNY